MTEVTADFTFVRRADIEQWAILTIKEYRDLLNQLEIPDEYEVMPNAAGNLMLFRPAPNDGVRWYVGYIDVMLRTAVIEPTRRDQVRFDMIKVSQRPNGHVTHKQVIEEGRA